MTKKMCCCVIFLTSILFSAVVYAQQQEDKQGTITLKSKEDIANFKKMLEEKTTQHKKDGDNAAPAAAAQSAESKDLPEQPAFSDKDGVIVLKSPEDIKKFDEYLDKSGFDNGKTQDAGARQDQTGLVPPAASACGGTEQNTENK